MDRMKVLHDSHLQIWWPLLPESFQATYEPNVEERRPSIPGGEQDTQILILLFRYLTSSFTLSNIFNFAEFLFEKQGVGSDAIRKRWNSKMLQNCSLPLNTTAGEGVIVCSWLAEQTLVSVLSLVVKAPDPKRPQPTWRAKEMVRVKLFPYAFPELRNRSALELTGKGSNLSSFTLFRKLPGEFMTLVYQTPFWVLILERESETSLKSLKATNLFIHKFNKICLNRI